MCAALGCPDPHNLLLEDTDMPKAPKGRTNRLDKLEFQCPWRGHKLEPAPIVVRNPSVPGLVGRICHDCSCMVYVIEKVSPLVTPGGAPAPSQEQES